MDPAKSVVATNEPASKLNTLLLSRFASFLNLPKISTNPQLPLTKENLDFVFQNALNGK